MSSYLEAIEQEAELRKRREASNAHFKSIVQGYGELTYRTDQPDEQDNLYIKAWNCHVRANREPGAKEPNWYALFIAARYYGFGVAAGRETGRRDAFQDLRDMIGAKAEE